MSNLLIILFSYRELVSIYSVRCLFLEKKQTEKYTILTILVACAMIVMQRVLLSAIVVPAYPSNPGRFYIYSFIQAAIVAGTNLIPLYMGYQYQKIARLKVFHYLSGFFFVFAIGGLISNIFFYVNDSVLNIRDYWLIFFPISQNYFTYAVSCVLLFCSIPFLTKQLKKISPETVKKIIWFLTAGLVGCSTLFNKDPFGLQDGKSILWIFYLFLVGYALKEFEWTKKIRFKFLQVLLGLAILCGLILLMTQISLILRDNADTATRFSKPYTLFAMYYSVTLFSFLELVSEKIKLRISGSTLATFLVTSQVILVWPLTAYRVSTFLKRDFPASGKDWLINMFAFWGKYVAAIIIVFVVCMLLQKIPVVKRMINYFAFDSMDMLVERLVKVKNWIVKNRSYFFVAGFFYLLTFLQIYVLETKEGWKQSIQVALKIFVQREAPMVLSVIIIMGFFFLLLLITNRFWYAFSVTLVLDLILTVSTVIKMAMREEPVFPSDLKMLNSVSELFSMVSPALLIVAAIILIFLLVTSILLQRRLQKQYSVKMHWKRRVIGIIVLLFCFSGVFFINHKNSPSFILFNLFKVNKTFFNQQGAVKDNGPLIQFLNNVDIKVMDEPDGYSEAKIKEIMKKYDKEAAEINETRNEWLDNQTVVLNLSESFSDPARVPNLTLSSDPIPYIKSLISDGTGGSMLSVGYGGGTANMEWEGLTGLDISNLSASLVTPYTQLVENQDQSPNITDLFDESIAIHPYTATLYRRKQVFEKFGFDKFYYLDSPDKLTYTDKIDNSPRISDESAYNETLKALKSNTTTSQFIQLSTMQNHMPYDDYYDETDYTAEGTAVVSSRMNELETYMQGIHYTDEAVKKFIQEIDKIDKPITFVFYGDHLPSIYSGNDMKTYGLVQHETDYFIYSNAYSRKQAKELNKEIVSPSNFGAMALEQANIKVTPYYALLTEMTNEVPATTIDPTESLSNRFNGKQVFVTEDNKIIYEDDLTSEQKEILEDYKLIQYDLVAGNQYAAKWAEQKAN